MNQLVFNYGKLKIKLNNLECEELLRLNNEKSF